MAEKIRSFWDFNFGHALVLIGMGGGVFSIHVQRERDMARFELSLQSHAAQLAMLNERVNAHDNASRKIDAKVDVIINDIGWIKNELLRRQRDE